LSCRDIRLVVPALFLARKLDRKLLQFEHGLSPRDLACGLPLRELSSLRDYECDQIRISHGRNEPFVRLIKALRAREGVFGAF
jgi:hypothetical protein